VTNSVTPSPTGTALRLTVEQAAKVLLSPEDLPTPYQVDPSISPDTRAALPPGCPLLDALATAVRTAPVRAARGFVGGAVSPFLEEHVAVLPGSAADRLSQFGRALSTCRTFDSHDPDGVTVRFTLTPLVSLDGGVDTVALTMSGKVTKGSSDTVVNQAVLTARGDVLLLFVYSGVDKLDPDVLAAALAKATKTLDSFR
jgi:hypothetical protein